MNEVQNKECGSGGKCSHSPYLSCDISSSLASPCCAILESISDGVMTVDQEKKISSFNRAAERITGFSAAEAIGQHCGDVLRASRCAGDCPLDATLRTGAATKNVSTEIITKSGSRKPISLSTSALRGGGGIIGGVETFRDLSDLEQLRKEVSRDYTYEDIVGRHPKIRDVLSLLPDIARSSSAVLITGPTGSGKELFARAVHNLSPRKQGPFIPVNCAAFPDTLLESELFGHGKGAFTGAVKSKSGRFELAHNGTLFLDEIGSTSPAFQADLLRVLQDGEFTPLGETRSRKADFRIVAAANQDLRRMVTEGSFRQDLYYRLNVAHVILPSLRERREDIPLLVDHFIAKYNLIQGRSIRLMTEKALAFLMDYTFPGNVRELQNIIEYAFIRCKGDAIGLEHLPADILDPGAEPDPPVSGVGEETDEGARISSALRRHQWNRGKTARALGMGRTTLWRKMKQYGLTAIPPEDEES